MFNEQYLKDNYENTNINNYYYTKFNIRKNEIYIKIPLSIWINTKLDNRNENELIDVRTNKSDVSDIIFDTYKIYELNL